MTRNSSTARPRRAQSWARGPSQPPGSLSLGVDVDGDEAAVVVQLSGRAPRRRRKTRPCASPSPPPSRRRRRPRRRSCTSAATAAACRRRESGVASIARRDGRVEGVLALVVVGERDEDAAAVVLGRGDEAGVQARRGHTAVGTRLQPVDADLVDSVGLHGGVERGAVAEGPGADEVGAVRRGRRRERWPARRRPRSPTRPARTMREERGVPPPRPAGAAAAGVVGVRSHRAHDDGCSRRAKPRRCIRRIAPILPLARRL